MKMKRINICAPQKQRKAVLEAMQSMGAVELEFSETDYGVKFDTASKRTVFERNAQLLEDAIDVLDKYAPQKKSIADSLAGKDIIERQEFERVAGARRDIIEGAKQLMAIRGEAEVKRSEISALKAELTAIEPWLEADVPLGIGATRRTDIRFGSLSARYTEEELEEKLGGLAADIKTVSRDKNSWYIMVVSKKEDSAATTEILRSCGFAPPPKGCGGVPAEYKKELEDRISEAQRQEERLYDDIRKKASFRHELMTAADYYRIRAQKYEVLGKITQSPHTFFLSGYVPENEAETVERVLSEKYGAAVETEDTDTAPVKLANNGFAQPFEGVLESFGLPKKGEIDPSFIMSVFYVFLFGLMLSDAAYGAIISIACFVLLKKFRNMEQSMRKSLKMFMYCGLSTLFWGIMFGGYFGDAVSVASKTFFGHETELKPLWFAPLGDPMRMLMYSMLFGLIHLFTGLGIKGYMYLRDRDVLGFVSDTLAWLMLLVGLLMLLMESSIFASFTGSTVELGAAGHTAAVVLSAAGALIILVMSGRPSKNPVIQIAKGAYNLYGITSWLSDLLSYSRLLALGLATGVIASVINQMGAMGGKSVMGVIVFVIVFIIGHTFNIAINLLGAYVHTNRLQYVEFFGKFYEGGGKKFDPFREQTNYIKIKK